MPNSLPAGWFPDPLGRHEGRYWDGRAWTEHVTSHGHQGIDPPVDTTSVPTPIQAPADWYPDPFGHHERRYWDATHWTEHVSSRGLQGVDPPVHQAVVPAVERAVAPTVGRPSRRVEQQVRKVGAGYGQAGGGTLFTEQVLVVNQKAKLLGSTVCYAVYNQNGQQLGAIQELRRNLSTKWTDSLRLRTESNRVHRYQIVDMNDRVLLAMTRPEMGWFEFRAKLVVEGPEGAPIGQIAQESIGLGGSIASAAHAGITSASAIAQVGLGGFTGVVAGAALGGVQGRLTSAVEGLDKVGHARFGLEAGGQRLGSVHAESVKEWNFNVQDPAGTEIARITKTWAGWVKERFTKADHYVVQMHRPLEEPLRSLVIAAALAIDVELKQRGDQTRGSSFWGTRRYD